MVEPHSNEHWLVDPWLQWDEEGSPGMMEPRSNEHWIWLQWPLDEAMPYCGADEAMPYFVAMRMSSAA